MVGYDKNIAHYYKQTSSLVEGVYVVSLDPQGPAYKSGIKINDIITRVDDKPVTKMLELRTTVYTHRVGEVVQLIVIRDGREMEIEMTLEQNPVLTAN